MGTNLEVIYIIKAKGDFVGRMEAWCSPTPDLPDGWLPCDGRYLPIEKYIDLYRVIGDQFCSKFLHRPLTRFEKIKRFFGCKIDTRCLNPNYKEGYFQLPDSRGQWITVED